MHWCIVEDKGIGPIKSDYRRGADSCARSGERAFAQTLCAGMPLPKVLGSNIDAHCAVARCFKLVSYHEHNSWCLGLLVLLHAASNLLARAFAIKYAVDKP